MELQFLGAAHEVTGSCTLLTAAGSSILIDCGMEQGRDIYENCPFPIAPNAVTAVLLTHAHIDHSGRLPYLTSIGYSGPIFSTVSTKKLCAVMLQDSAHIQEQEAIWRNRKAQRAGKEEVIPLYTVTDAQKCMSQFTACEYGETVRVAPGITARFIDAGHLLGSSSIEVTVTEGGDTKTIVFSGDIGNTNQPIIRDPQYLCKADFVMMESTYGDRSHGERADYIKQLVPILQRTFDRGGNVVIPSFAVGRTQELLYFMRQIKEERLIKGNEGFPVYVDSPLAVEATNIFKDSAPDFDDDATALIKAGINPISFPDLKISVTSDDSRAINEDTTPKVIISASGMCEAGRIRHHLKHNLWRKECAVLFVGYQAEGTLGRTITDGATEVKLFDERIQVSAEIYQLNGISGHADNEGLIAWISHFSDKPTHVFVNHGEDSVCEIFKDRLINELGLEASAPYNGEVYSLTENKTVTEGNKVKIERTAVSFLKPAARKAAAVFERLVSAGKRLQTVILHNEGGSNKDLAKFADQIIALCEKWDR